MDSFFRENRESYVQQVAAFKSSPKNDTNGSREPSGDTLIATRVRPLLAKEIEDGEVVGISVRPESGHADVHELRRKINGHPGLNVSELLSPEVRNSDIFNSLLASGSTKFMDLATPRRTCTAILSHHWYHGHGEVGSVLCLRMVRLDRERRTA